MTGKSLPPDYLTEEIADQLLRLLPMHHQKLFKGVLGIPGMKMAGYRVLITLANCGPVPISGIAKGLYISKPYMTRLVDMLIADGLVERQPDVTDRRIVNIVITPRGKERIHEMGTYFRGDIISALSGLETQDLVRMNECLANLHRMLALIETP